MSLQYLLKTVDSILFPKLHVIYVFFSCVAEWTCWIYVVML